MLVETPGGTQLCESKARVPAPAPPPTEENLRPNGQGPRTHPHADLETRTACFRFHSAWVSTWGDSGTVHPPCPPAFQSYVQVQGSLCGTKAPGREDQVPGCYHQEPARRLPLLGPMRLQRHHDRINLPKLRCLGGLQGPWLRPPHHHQSPFCRASAVSELYPFQGGHSFQGRWSSPVPPRGKCLLTGETPLRVTTLDTDPGRGKSSRKITGAPCPTCWPEARDLGVPRAQADRAASCSLSRAWPRANPQSGAKARSRTTGEPEALGSSSPAPGQMSTGPPPTAASLGP